jgi:ABC-2 type transport system permease protein
VIGLIRSEWIKLRTTQVWLWLLLGMAAITALFVVVTILGDGAGGNPTPRLVTPEGQRNLFALAAAASLFSVVLGIIGVTGEYRHQTVTPTYLVTPRRNRVVVAKLITYALVGLLYAVVTSLVVIAMAVPWLKAKNIDVSLTSNRIPLVLLAALTVVAIYGIVGVGVGALIPNQVAAVVITLAYLFIVENLLQALPWVKDYYKYLPGGAAAAVTQGFVGDTSLLEPWQGGLVLAAYGIGFALLASWLTIRRDVT